MKRRRGNPNWGKESVVLMPASPSQWELLLEHLGISELDKDRIRRSVKLKQFALKNYRNRYVPEWFLDEWELYSDDDFCFARPTDNARYVPVAFR